MIHAQRLPAVRPASIVEDPDVIRGYVDDASGLPAGSGVGLARPESESETAALLASTGSMPVLAQAARSSLTGGAIPRGELIVSVERMGERGPVSRSGAGGRVTVQPGMRLVDLQESLAAEHLYYPPVPTWNRAMLGGTVATNAGGAASFKYGATRAWVHGLRVLLWNGELLVLERGQCVARRGESFHIALSDGSMLQVPVPDHRLPALKKVSAGYHAADPLDLVDLFVGSEGTLGLITAITVNVAPLPRAVLTGLVVLDDANLARLLGAALHDQAERTRERADPLGLDIRAIEWLDEGCLRLLREHGDARRLRVDLPDDARAALLFELEMPRAVDEAAVLAALEDLRERRGELGDGPLPRLFRVLEDHRALDGLTLALPGDVARQRALTDLREAVPTRVNEILAGRRSADAGVHKAGGDLIVPFHELPAMLDVYRSGFARRGLECAVWGHFADGNLHPNAIPRSAAEARSGLDAQMEFADEAARRGGAPLSEHGVGRSPTKQAILRRFLGEAAVDRMRMIKRALDPPGRFAPGVLFPA